MGNRSCEIDQQPPRGHNKIGQQDRLLPLAGESIHPGGIGAQHIQQRSLQTSPHYLC
jgi:hypothetical protein